MSTFFFFEKFLDFIVVYNCLAILIHVIRISSIENPNITFLFVSVLHLIRKNIPSPPGQPEQQLPHRGG